MICPFSLMTRKRHHRNLFGWIVGLFWKPDETFEFGLVCNKEQCAWWDAKKKQCCIKTLSELKITGNTHSY